MKVTTRLKLAAAGWRPDRNVWDQLRLPVSFELFPEAQRILSCYGGLKFGDRNEYAMFDPSAADENADQIRECERRVGRRLYPLGYELHQDAEYFLVDESGLIYLLIGDTLHLLAASFENALDFIVECRFMRTDVEAGLKASGMAMMRWELKERS